MENVNAGVIPSPHPKIKGGRRIDKKDWDIEALNELLRQKTGMGQGEIDAEAYDIKKQLKKKYRKPSIIFCPCKESENDKED